MLMGRVKRCAKCARAGRKRVYVALPGDRYGPKTIIREEGYQGPHRMVLVQCECGAEQRYEFAKVRARKVSTACCKEFWHLRSLRRDD